MCKRILLTIPNFDTAGSGKAMLRIAKGLNSDKYEVHLACEHEGGSFFETVKASGLPVHILPITTPMNKRLKMLWSCFKLSRKLKKLNLDLIHSYHYSGEFTEALSAKLAGIPWVFTKKNMSWGGGSAKQWKLRSMLAKRIAIQNTDMKKQFYPNSDKTFYLPRGVATEQFAPGDRNPAVRQSMETSATDRIFIVVANMVPVKGIEVLLEAFKTLHPKLANWKLWLVGDDTEKYGQKLHAFVEEQGLKQSVRFSGKVDNVIDYLNHAEIFVLPTLDEGRREGSPVALLEAMANGKLVIASDIPGVRDQLKDFKDHLFKAGDVPELVNKLERFTQNTEEQNHNLGQAFLEHVVQNHQLEGEIKRHEELYDSIL